MNTNKQVASTQMVTPAPDRIINKIYNDNNSGENFIVRNWENCAPRSIQNKYPIKLATDDTLVLNKEMAEIFNKLTDAQRDYLESKIAQLEKQNLETAKTIINDLEEKEELNEIKAYANDPSKDKYIEKIINDTFYKLHLVTPQSSTVETVKNNLKDLGQKLQNVPSLQKTVVSMHMNDIQSQIEKYGETEETYHQRAQKSLEHRAEESHNKVFEKAEESHKKVLDKAEDSSPPPSKEISEYEYKLGTIFHTNDQIYHDNHNNTDAHPYDHH